MESLALKPLSHGELGELALLFIPLSKFYAEEVFFVKIRLNSHHT
jgi:hypothetical protein